MIQRGTARTPGVVKIDNSSHIRGSLHSQAFSIVRRTRPPSVHSQDSVGRRWVQNRWHLVVPAPEGRAGPCSPNPIHTLSVHRSGSVGQTPGTGGPWDLGSRMACMSFTPAPREPGRRQWGPGWEDTALCTLSRLPVPLSMGGKLPGESSEGRPWPVGDWQVQGSQRPRHCLWLLCPYVTRSTHLFKTVDATKAAAAFEVASGISSSLSCGCLKTSPSASWLTLWHFL